MKNENAVQPMDGEWLRGQKRTYKLGTSTIPKMVAASMPKHVQMPMDFIDQEPAPEANTSGSTPMMKLHAVIITAR